ncbi:four helix bundle protein [Moheibacter lacus]|uniref:Four helix bundle protein n=1 Tax=Moheibacter lacus TaxID=2745851 RepID=A0A838ZSL8_9FLAO|nr:four helix bundle protein [Moheibacter lacus]MBA5629976.1 four helix bundle protein [Moheibacter lacus]
MALIKYHKDLIVYQKAFESAMEIFNLTKTFPSEEKYALTDQIRRSSRSVCGNLAEAWRKRRYEKLFVNKLIDSEGEAAETQNWLDFALACNYLNEETYKELYIKYDEILAMLVKLSKDYEKWTFQKHTQ